jgi:hypothetical protein
MATPDRALLIVALRTRLGDDELCGLKREHVHLGRQGSKVAAYGNMHSEVRLQSTSLEAHLVSALPVSIWQARRGQRRRRLGWRTRAALQREQRAEKARGRDLSPHHLHRFGDRAALTLPLQGLAQQNGAMTRPIRWASSLSKVELRQP